MADAALEKKKNVRRGHRGSATKLIGRINTALAASPADEDKLRQLQLSLTDKLQVLKILDDDIVDSTPEDELAREIEQADEAREEIHLALTKLERALRAFAPAPPRTTMADLASTTAATIATAPHPMKPMINLPKITIQQFDGSLTSWTPFWDSFEAAIHGNDTLSDVDKFNYLRGFLKGTALDAISGLTLTSANYKQAVETLQKRFGNKPLIVSKHMDALLHVETITSAHNTKGLRHVYDTVESNVRSLESLGVESESYGGLVASVLMSKLPMELQLIVAREMGTDDDWDLKKLMESFEKELRARERTITPTSRKPSTNFKDVPTTSTLFARNNGDRTYTCSYCKGDHPSNSCNVITHPDARKQALQRAGKCFVCLRKGHISRECRSSKRCSKCQGRHHISICSQGVGDSHRSTDDKHQGQGGANHQGGQSRQSKSNAPTTTDPSRPNLDISAPPFQSQHTLNMWVSSSTSVLLQTAQAIALNPDQSRSRKVRMVFDTGSHRSYITERVANDLRLSSEGRHLMTIGTFGSQAQQPRVCDLVRLSISLKNGNQKQLSLLTVPFICDPLSNQPVDFCQNTFSHLVDLDLADPASNNCHPLDIEVLIGLDYYWDLTTGRTRRGSHGPVAVETKLGWVLSGPAPTTGDSQCSLLTTSHTLKIDSSPSPNQDREVVDLLQSFWDLETMGITETEHTLYDEFCDKITIRDGRYEVSLPWREVHQPLPDNQQLCKSRLKGLLHRLHQKPSLLKQYDDIIQDQLDQGVIEQVDHPDSVTGECHYLPHHAVVRQDKSTTKLRIVYDGSAKCNGSPSLNDCLEKGPKFNQLVFDLLVRFRQHQVALVADLEKAFLQISVVEHDRDFLRFFWPSDITREDSPLQTFRFARVLFGLSPSPFLLNATIRHHIQQYKSSLPDVVDRLLESIYVDDVITGADTKEEVLQLYRHAKNIFRDASFNLRKFHSNSQSLQQEIDRIEESSNQDTWKTRTPSVTETSGQSLKLSPSNASSMGSEEQKVLGICWRHTDDMLVFDISGISQLANKCEPTKRTVTSIIGRFYDPLGFLSPLTISYKVFLQALCNDKVAWDCPLPAELSQQWNKLVSQLRGSPLISLPRCYSTYPNNEIVSSHLCGFCDASQKAYAAVVYLVSVSKYDANVSFVAAKTRVSPLRSLTIPRLELLSAVLLTRLVCSVKEALHPLIPEVKVKCFTDSSVTLYWIQGVDKDWKPFVRNRVTEIRRKVLPEFWSHCPGQINPADLPSRGISLAELSVSKLWRHGPDWLPDIVLSNRELNVSTSDQCMPSECLLELKVLSKPVHTMLTMQQQTAVSNLLTCEDYSSLLHLLRVTAFVLKAVKRFKGEPNANPSYPNLSPLELAAAEQLWVIDSQRLLTNDKQFKQWQQQLGLFKDETGVLRCHGRIQNAAVPYSTKHPALLCKSHHFTLLIVRKAHEAVLHDGVRETLAEIRAKFWIVKGRSFVRSVIHHCHVCRRYEGKSYGAPPPPPLPSFRVEEAPPFTFLGVDFAGPLYIRSENGSRKVWICLYTCCVVRAVHLDLVVDLTAPCFLLSFRRFVARRGLPRKILSDNGKTFKAAAKSLHQVKWEFNVPKAPWWGGIFERLVRSTKRCLRKTIGQARLTYDELLTALTEVENVINSRPLSYMSTTDLEEPLTPSHLIVGRRLMNTPDYSTHESDEDDNTYEVNCDTLTRRAKHLNSSIDKFWRRWRREYLVELRESHKLFNKWTKAPRVSVNDIVIIHDDNQRHGAWPLGRVEEVLPGRDGEERAAVVRIAKEGRRAQRLCRPVQKLYPLEMISELKQTPTTNVTNCPSTNSDDEDAREEAQPRQENEPDKIEERRPRRAAATEARDRLLAQALEDSTD